VDDNSMYAITPTAHKSDCEVYTPFNTCGDMV
jgi:hypothetical protein